MKTQTITINNHQFVLHPSGAMYWEREKTVLIADVHFGKVTHFRKHGSAVPLEVLFENFKRLDEVINLFQPTSMYFMGDLFHSHLNNEWSLFEDWVKKQGITFFLITGNHDIISPLLYESIGFKLVDTLHVNEFLLTHHPTESDSLFNIAGHIHPGIMLRGIGRQRIKLPCFHRSKRQLILPAFGTFTGKHVIKPQKDDAIYAIVENEVLSIKIE